MILLAAPRDAFLCLPGGVRLGLAGWAGDTRHLALGGSVRWTVQVSHALYPAVVRAAPRILLGIAALLLLVVEGTALPAGEVRRAEREGAPAEGSYPAGPRPSRAR